MLGVAAVGGFLVGLLALDRYLRRRDRDGYWDRDWRSSAARPGLKRLLDMSRDGFGGDGINQRHVHH